MSPPSTSLRMNLFPVTHIPLAVSIHTGKPAIAEEHLVAFTRTPLSEIGTYSKSKIALGYDATLWYAHTNNCMDWTIKRAFTKRGEAKNGQIRRTVTNYKNAIKLPAHN